MQNKLKESAPSVVTINKALLKTLTVSNSDVMLYSCICITFELS